MSTVIGIITRVCNVNAPPHERFGNLTSFYQEVTRYALKHNCHVFISTVKDFNQHNHTMYGWVWRNNDWHYRPQPVPHVLYNRITSRKLERSEQYENLVQHFRTNHKTTVFNERYFTKWEIYQALVEDRSVRAYLPETHLYSGIHILKQMMDRYGSVILKPSFGSLGEGVIRVSTVPSGYMTQIPSINGSTRKVFSSLSGVAESIGIRTHKRAYLIQRCIDLIKVNGKPLDIRALIQKDGTGNWAVSSMVARISYNEQSIVSNLARGGTLMTLREALAKSHSFTGAKPTVAYARNAAIEIANALEKNVEGTFGELGIDLAIDKEGQVWLLEINSKPNKRDTTVLNPDTMKGPRPSIVRFISYCRYLSGDLKPSPNGKEKTKKKRKQR